VDSQHRVGWQLCLVRAEKDLDLEVAPAQLRNVAGLNVLEIN
jgi:hypothetical protein